MSMIPKRVFVQTFHFIIGSTDDFGHEVGPISDHYKLPEEKRYLNMSVYEVAVTSTNNNPTEEDWDSARNLGAGMAFYGGWCKDDVIIIMEHKQSEECEAREYRLWNLRQKGL